MSTVLPEAPRYEPPQRRGTGAPLARDGVIFEPRDVSQGQEAAVKYHVSMDRRLSLEDLSAQLSAGAAALRSVVWKNPKKSGR